MTPAKWLTLAGGIFLFVGLVTALISSRYESRVMGQARLGVAVLAAEKDTPEWREKNRLRARVNFWFWVGLGLTAVGIVLQTQAAVLPISPPAQP